MSQIGDAFQAGRRLGLQEASRGNRGGDAPSIVQMQLDALANARDGLDETLGDRNRAQDGHERALAKSAQATQRLRLGAGLGSGRAGDPDLSPELRRLIADVIRTHDDAVGTFGEMARAADVHTEAHREALRAIDSIVGLGSGTGHGEPDAKKSTTPEDYRPGLEAFKADGFGTPGMPDNVIDHPNRATRTAALFKAPVAGDPGGAA